MTKNYTIGLDIGTNSVGWAVMADNYDLIRKNMPIQGNTNKQKMKKNFWGVRLFDEGETAEARRLKRTTRRRYTRRRQRLMYLQDIFQEEMAVADPNFFSRLDNSFLVKEDKDYKHPIFGTLEEEVTYHDNYPTIYHLRQVLVDNREQMDLRLVYLAMAHIVKYRGHFLIEGNLNMENTSINQTFKDFLVSYNQLQEEGAHALGIDAVSEEIDIEPIFHNSQSRSAYFDDVIVLFEGEKRNSFFAQLIKLIVGNQGNFKASFKLEEDAKLQFSSEEYEEDLSELLGLIGDEYSDVFVKANQVHDAIELSRILSNSVGETNAKLSSGMIERYSEHKEDLKALKKIIRTNAPDKYDVIFKDQSVHGYAGYIEGKTKEEEFYKYMKKELGNVTGAEVFIEKIEQENFLRKQRTFDNGVIPHQIHLAEMEHIINNQGKYYPFLREQKEKITQIVTFRIPYYVGPLAKKGESDFAWLTRKEGAITPWNFHEQVDEAASATEFIEKMTNRDMYLRKEHVLPKHSMLYQQYSVFNELTKVSYVDDQGVTCYFSGEEKKRIFNQLFKEGKNRGRVTKKLLLSFLTAEYHLESPEIKGIETSFNASYTTYHDLMKMGVSKELLEDEQNAEMFEEIIKVLTIFEDRKMLKEQLSQYSEMFSPSTLKKLERRHYTGWGRLSQTLINGIRDEDSQKTILFFLMEDEGPNKIINRNFMQLINDPKLSFKETIEKAQTETNADNLASLVEGLAGSPAIKKGILQSLKIVDELVDVMGYAPTSIVVEMARENQTTGKGNSNAKPRYKKLEKSLKELKSDVLKRYPTDNKALRNNRLYLYYLQNGKDMYTGEPLDISKLSDYDVDHIIPQSFIKDNSLDNLVLVSSKVNRGKSDDVPSQHVVNKMMPLWMSLHRSGLISKRKLDNLTRGQLTDDDKQQFIHRQLVETRQITKHVAQILDQRFNPSYYQETEGKRQVNIVTLKSSLVSQFRQQFNLHKVREINDYHHAHDAYLNAAVGTTLLTVYPKLTPEFVYGEYHKGNIYAARKATAKKQFYTNIMAFFGSNEKIVNEDGEIVWDRVYVQKMMKVLNYRHMNVVKKVERQKGSFTNETVHPKGNGSKLIPRKQHLDPVKYGGFKSPTTVCTVLFTYEKGKSKKVTRDALGITLMEINTYESDKEAFLRDKGFINPCIKKELSKYALAEYDNGRRRLLASAEEVRKGNQLVIPQHLVTLLYHAKRCELDKELSIHYVEEHRAQFKEVLDYVDGFNETYILSNKNMATINKLYEEHQEADVKVLAESFVNLMSFTAMRAATDFKFFGVNIPRYRYQNKAHVVNFFDAVLIHQSITGLYETREKMAYNCC